MNKAAKKYYRDLKLLIPTRGKTEKRFLNDIRIRVMEFGETSPDVTYEQICEELGEPRELAIEYFSSIHSEYVIKKLRVAQYIRCLIISLIVAVFITTGVHSYYLYQLYVEARDTIITEKTIIIE